MEALGPNLTTLVNKEVGDIKRQNYMILKAAHDLVKRLEQLHSLGYCHGDIKPENLCRGSDGKFYLIDFGIAEKYLARDGTHRK